jgi:transposase
MSYTGQSLHKVKFKNSINMKKESSHNKHYSESFKLEVLRDYYEKGLTKYAAVKKWNLKGSSSITRWMQEYPIDSKCLSLSAEIIETRMEKKTSETKEEELGRRIKDLEKALSYEKLRSLAYSTLIDIAEKEYKISIRKKTGTRQ